MLPEPTLQLTNAEYHQLDGRVSSTMLKVFRESPELYRDMYVDRIMEPMRPTRAMVIGSAIHLLLLEQPDLLIPAGMSRNSEAWRSRNERAEGDELVLPRPDYDAAIAGAESIRNPQTPAADVAHRLLLETDGENERAVHWSERSIHSKCKPDRLAWSVWSCDRPVLGLSSADDFLHVDLKTARDPSPQAFRNQAWELGYDVQTAFYRRGIASLIARPITSVWVVVRNEPPYDVAVYPISERMLAFGDARLERDLGRLERAVDRGDWSAYWQRTNENGRLREMDPPPWAYRDVELSMKVSEAFAGSDEFITAEDLKGKPRQKTIESVKFEQHDDYGPSYVLEFSDAKKKLRIKKKNSKLLANAFGDDPVSKGHWNGKAVVLNPDDSEKGAWVRLSLPVEDDDEGDDL